MTTEFFDVDAFVVFKAVNRKTNNQIGIALVYNDMASFWRGSCKDNYISTYWLQSLKMNRNESLKEMLYFFNVKSFVPIHDGYDDELEIMLEENGCFGKLINFMIVNSHEKHSISLKKFIADSYMHEKIAKFNKGIIFNSDFNQIIVDLL